MKIQAFVTALTTLSVAASSVFSVRVDAAEPKKTYGQLFEKDDWELVCDNVKRCHAIGYYATNGNGFNLVSIMISRDAGPNTKLRGQIAIGDENFGGASGVLVAQSLKPPVRIRRLVDNAKTRIPDADVSRLVNSIVNDSLLTIESNAGDAAISLQGAKSVFLKMDEVQGRLDTPSAIVKKGRRSERFVPRAGIVPMVKVTSAPATTPADEEKLPAIKKAVSNLPQHPLHEHCRTDSIDDGGIQRLSSTKLIFTAKCFGGAYNEVDANWIVADRAPFEATATELGEFDPADRSINMHAKGRGPGDCIHEERHHFDGSKFVKTFETNDRCMGFLGGAWQVPYYRAVIKK
jgi:hypothetical protein